MDLLTERLHSPNGGGGATGVVSSVGIEGLRRLAVRSTAELELATLVLFLTVGGLSATVCTSPLPAVR
jgi:hypothetical protein